ncbi:MAG: hypothetical protein R2860_12250 [Desulfobacterales bacterium]
MDDMDFVKSMGSCRAGAVLPGPARTRLGASPRVNCYGGAIAYGHPLAASGPRLVAFLDNLFEENPGARYGLTTLCVGRGPGGIDHLGEPDGFVKSPTAVLHCILRHST